MAPRTAILVLNWNSREMTAECLRTLFAMERPTGDFQVLVVDNGSRDGSVEYLRKLFPQIETIANGRNLGFAAGCNVGMRFLMEQGIEYIVLLNNDTIVDSGFIKHLVDAADRNPGAAMISPKIYFYDLPDRFWWGGGSYSLWTGISMHLFRKQKDVGQSDQERSIDWANGCAVLIRSSALRQVGLFDEQTFGNGEDLDLSLRMRTAGYDIRYAPKSMLWHKEGVDYRKNVGEHIRKFTGTRNVLWIMHKHARTIHWFTFWPNFLVRYVAFFILLSIWRRDFRSAWAVVQGISAFFQMLAHPDRSVLPPELRATADAPTPSDNELTVTDRR